MTEFDMKLCRWEKVMAAVIVALVLCALVCASVIVIGWAGYECVLDDGTVVNIEQRQRAIDSGKVEPPK